MSERMLEAIADWAGILMGPDELRKLRTLEGWLATEGVELGGLGPNEVPEIAARHLADSLSFARGWASGPAPEAIVDLGSGLGLPALPLAICHPNSAIWAIDRSVRRCQMLRRAARVVGVENLVVEVADITRFARQAHAVVSRAAIPPDLLLPHLQRLTLPGGVAVVGGSHRARPEVPGYDTVEIPAEILDHSAWLLMMAAP